MKIEPIKLSYMRGKEHFKFMTDVIRGIAKHQAKELGIDPQLYHAFEKAYQTEDLTLSVEQGSIKSKAIDELDSKRDMAWCALYKRVKASTIYAFADEMASAELIMRVFDKYGDMRTQSFNEESAGLMKLTSDLQQPQMASHLDKLGLTLGVAELKKLNDEFMNVFDDRDVELGNRISGNMRSARMAIDPLYLQMVEQMNAAIVLKIAKPAVAAFVTELNEKIGYYKTTMNIRSSRNAKEIVSENDLN